MLEESFNKVKTLSSTGERFEVLKVKGIIQGKNTILTNIKEISENLRRPLEHLAKFLQKELAVQGRIENERFILKSRLNSNRVNEKINEYIKLFVICPVCGKPDTEIKVDKGAKIKHCLACGANSPINYNI